MGNKPSTVSYDCKNLISIVKEYINNENHQLSIPRIRVEERKQIKNSNFLKNAKSDDLILFSLDVINQIFSKTINREINNTVYNSLCIYSGINNQIQNQSMFIFNYHLNLLNKKYEKMNYHENGLFHKLDDLSSIKAKSHLKISMTDYDKTSIVKDKDNSMKINIINTTVEKKEMTQPRVRSVLKKPNKNDQKRGSLFLKRRMNYISPETIRKLDDYDYKSEM
jgi:hypothetical protein